MADVSPEKIFLLKQRETSTNNKQRNNVARQVEVFCISPPLVQIDLLLTTNREGNIKLSPCRIDRAIAR